MKTILFICSFLLLASANTNGLVISGPAIVDDSGTMLADTQSTSSSSVADDVSISPMLPFYKNQETAPKKESKTQLLIDHTYQLSISLLIFTAATMALMAYLLYLRIPAASIMKVYGTFTIVCVAAFLVIAGYSETQIAPIIGLFGTVIGYILGKTSSTSGQDRVG